MFTQHRHIDMHTNTFRSNTF